MRSLIAGWVLGMAMMAGGWAGETVPADDPRIEYSDCSRKIVADGKVGFERVVKHNRNYHLDNPGARMRFRCDAKEIAVALDYGERNQPKRAQNGVGVFLVDGKGREEWTYNRPKPGSDPETVVVKLPADGQMHDYEVVLPYGDRVTFVSVTVSDDAKFEKPAPRPALRVAFYGDSVTHGYEASRIDRTYPYLVGLANGYEVVNLALGGYSIAPGQADEMGRLEGIDVLVLASGVNNWQGGQKPEDVKKRTVLFLQKLRAARPDLPIVYITPLWVAPSWKARTPGKDAPYELAEYRTACAEAMNEAVGKNMLMIDGDQLIDHDDAMFSPTAVHPNDKGFAQMALRVAAALKPFTDGLPKSGK